MRRRSRRLTVVSNPLRILVAAASLARSFDAGRNVSCELRIAERVFAPDVVLLEAGRPAGRNLSAVRRRNVGAVGRWDRNGAVGGNDNGRTGQC